MGAHAYTQRQIAVIMQQIGLGNPGCIAEVRNCIWRLRRTGVKVMAMTMGPIFEKSYDDFMIIIMTNI